MSTSSDERREVARRIRNNIGEQASWVIPWAVFNDAAHHGDRETMERLADLIDPITTVELRAPWTICMKCGARMEGYQHKPVRFCPHFGRRIVR